MQILWGVMHFRYMILTIRQKPNHLKASRINWRFIQKCFKRRITMIYTETENLPAGQDECNMKKDSGNVNLRWSIIYSSPVWNNKLKIKTITEISAFDVCVNFFSNFK